MHVIESDVWRLGCEPSNGVQWCCAEVRRDDRWISVVPDCRLPVDQGSLPRAGQDESAPLSAASFHMLPYSNRVRDGKFSFAGQSYELADAHRHAIHGALRNLPWSITAAESDRLVCTIDTTTISDINWPWPLRCQITHQVTQATLSSVIELENLGHTAMPAGGGWHPYFVRDIDGAHPTLTLPVQEVFPDRNGDCLPDGEPVALPEHLDFRHAKALDPSQHIDCCLSGLSDACVIDWQDAGISLTLAASPCCRFLVLYNPAMPHFAVEPVTNANDGFNLQSRGIDAGVMILQPGETLQMRLDISASISG